MENKHGSTGFSLAGGIYREEDLLEICYEDDLTLNQKKIQKSMLTLESYKRFSDQYMVLYWNPDKPKFSMSKKLDVKYIYNMSFLSSTQETLAAFDYGVSPAVLALRNYQVRQKRLEERKRAELSAFARKADNYERFGHDSFYTNKERYVRGRMSQEAYYDELFWRNYYESEIASKYETEYRVMDRKLKEAMALSKEEIGKPKPVKIEKHEKMRYMPVGEAVYYDGRLMALAVYKTPQELREVEWKEKTTLDQMEGILYKEKIMMSQIPDYGPLFLALAQLYSEKIPPVEAAADCSLHCQEQVKKMWKEAREIAES